MSTISKNKSFNLKYDSGTSLFLSFFRRNVWQLILAIILTGFQAFIGLIPSWAIGQSINILETEGFTSTFIKTSSLIVAAAIVGFIITYIGNVTFITAAFSYERDVRQEYFEALQSHNLTFHDENNSSILLSLGMNDLQMIRQALFPGMRMLISSILSAIFIMVYLKTSELVSQNLTIILGIGFILYFLVAYIYASKIAPLRKQVSEELGNITESTQEIFRGIEVVRSFSTQRREINRFKKISRDYAGLTEREQKLSAFYFPGLILILMIAYTFYSTAIQVRNGTMEVGDMVTIIGLLLTLQAVNFMLPFALLGIRGALVNADKIYEKMAWKTEFDEYSESVVDNVDWESDIRFRDVTFRYRPDLQPALEDINITLPAKGRVSVIGGPGAGKSSFLKLILNLYIPQKGDICIGETNFKDISAVDLRKHISLVEQETTLFTGTIFDNIAFSKSGATEEEVIEASKAAQAWEFIESFENGLNTVIGERGVTLSGGQRQRLAIARAILANPEVLLLDDSSSALDAATELKIRKALDNLSQGRLTITVTQRLRTLINSDLIILLEKGRLIASGTHNELYKSSEKYRRIFELLPESEVLKFRKEQSKGGLN